MADAGRRATPLPLAQAFVICREIIEDCRSHEFILLRPFSFVNTAGFPVKCRMSFYAHLTCGHGDYELVLQLRDEDARQLWQWRIPHRVRLPDPLSQYRLNLSNAVMEFPQPGRYDFVLLTNGEELARHALQVRLQPRQKAEPGPLPGPPNEA